VTTPNPAPVPAAAPVGLVKPRLRGISHRYAFFVSIVFAVVIIAAAPSGLATFGVVVYGVTMVGMFGASALYHGPNWSVRNATRFLRIDHTAIFLFIAGTATPILLLTSSGAMRAIVLSVVWGIALGGVVFEWLPIRAPRGYVTTVYLVLGWVCLLALGDLWRETGVGGVALIAAGGALYTAGAIVHAAHRPDPWPLVFGYHEIFHLLVIGAVVLHYCAIAFCVLPLAS
jgi:hemolysin III